MDEILRDILRIVVVPSLIMLGGFALEILAVRARGTQRGQQKFKLWLERPDGSLHSDSPCDVKHLAQRFRSRSSQADRVVDIAELASFEDYAGISFDLSISAFTADVVVLFNQQKLAEMNAKVAGAIVFHFLFLICIAALVAANRRAGPNEHEARARQRTVMTIVLGFFSLVSAFVVLWEAL